MAYGAAQPNNNIGDPRGHSKRLVAARGHETRAVCTAKVDRSAKGEKLPPGVALRRNPKQGDQDRVKNGALAMIGFACHPFSPMRRKAAIPCGMGPNLPVLIPLRPRHITGRPHFEDRQNRVLAARYLHLVGGAGRHAFPCRNIVTVQSISAPRGIGDHQRVVGPVQHRARGEGQRSGIDVGRLHIALVPIDRRRVGRNVGADRLSAVDLQGCGGCCRADAYVPTGYDQFAKWVCRTNSYVTETQPQLPNMLGYSTSLFDLLRILFP